MIRIEDTRRPIHFGVNLLVSPEAVLDSRSILSFESRLADHGISFDLREKSERSLTLATAESGLRVRLADMGPQVSQLVVVDPEPNESLDLFVKRAEMVCASFTEVWKRSQVLVHRDATIRHLYQSPEDHAFRYLWERRLAQKEEDLRCLGRPVLGGGLRLVTPARDPTDAQFEVRIESYLRDPRMLFVEVQCTWQSPVPIAGNLDPRPMLETVESFATKEVVAFIVGGGVVGGGP